jgi:hypothetical protein
VVHPSGDTPDPKVPDNPPVPEGASRAVGEMESNKPKLAAAQSDIRAGQDVQGHHRSATATC